MSGEIVVKYRSDWEDDLKYAHKGDAGIDLRSTEELKLFPNDPVAVSTGVYIELPEGYEAQIRPRSGFALYKAVTVLNTPGTIDSGYRGEIKVILINHGWYPVVINKGDRIAQMVINKLPEVLYERIDKLNKTERGDGGFGSTGIN